MMSNCTQTVRTLTSQRWQCSHCSQKPVADSQDKQMATMLDNKSPNVHKYQHRIFNGMLTASLENYYFWKISLRLQMWTWLASKRRRCIQRTRLMNSKTSQLSDVFDQCRLKREWGPMICIRRQIPYKISHLQASNSSVMEKHDD